MRDCFQKLYKVFIKAIFPIAFLLGAFNTNAQTPGLGTWSIISTKYTFNKKWSGFFEAQIRSQQFYVDYNYHEYKSGVGYNLPKNISLLFAIGKYNTYQFTGNFKTPMLINEIRTWQQLVLNNNINRLKIEHRYRFEQRFVNDIYRNRFRYRLNAILPINNIIVQEKTWYLSLSNEIFLNNRGVFFEQNRIFIGTGYEINDQVTMQAGWLNRFDNFDNGSEQKKNFFQLSLLLSFSENKSGRKRHPSSVD
ncbi:MAG: DUF2490 domain-containing protein [Chitinophagaceae bacterium]|nr:DUF2490 domain-containing protein [Chitinophagaceae bacterium]